MNETCIYIYIYIQVSTFRPPINLNPGSASVPRQSTYGITPRLIELRFLPVTARIKYKICSLANKSLLSGEPRYIEILLQPVLISSFHTSVSNRLVVLFLSRQNTIERSYLHCAPCLYNKLSFELRAIDDLPTFKNKLKTNFFE